MKRVLSWLLLISMMIVLPVSSLAVSQSRYEMVLEQRDQLYQQLVDAGLGPVVDINADLPELPTIEKTDEYELVRQYDWYFDSVYGDKFYRYIVLKNVSGEAGNFVAQVMYFDAEDNLIGVSNPETNTVEDGYEGLLVCVCDTKFDHIKYSIAKEKPQHIAFHTFVDVQTSVKDGKAIIIATNKGDTALKYFQYRILFLKNGEIVGDENSYLITTTRFFR